MERENKLHRSGDNKSNGVGTNEGQSRKDPLVRRERHDDEKELSSNKLLAYTAQKLGTVSKLEPE